MNTTLLLLLVLCKCMMYVGANRLVYSPEAEKDLVESLPGLQSKPGFELYSGYIDVSKAKGESRKMLHYIFTESSRNPSGDPVVFWSNGGPGCSGLLGWGTEQGPFKPNEDGTLESNPFAVSK